MNDQLYLRFKEMEKMIGSTQNKKVLELGAGRDKFEQVIDNFKSLKVDICGNPDIIHDLEKSLPFPNNSYDIIVAGEVLEHMKDAEFFMKECKRILKEKGEIILSVPNCCSLKIRLKMLVGVLDTNFCVPTTIKRLKYEEHYSSFSYEHLKNFLHECGFKIIDYKTEGIFTHAKRVFPIYLTPRSLGESIIVKCCKVKNG